MARMAPPSASRQTKISSFFQKKTINSDKTPTSSKSNKTPDTANNSPASAITRAAVEPTLQDPTQVVKDQIPPDTFEPSPETLILPSSLPPARPLFSETRTSTGREDEPTDQHSNDCEDEDEDEDEIMVDSSSQRSGEQSPSLELRAASSSGAGISSSAAAAAEARRTRAHGSFSTTPITPAFMPAYQRLLKTLLPVAYPARFFTETIESHSALGRVAVWHSDASGGGEVVGGIKGRLEDIDPDDGDWASSAPAPVPGVLDQHVYIQTLGVLAPFRGHGVAAQMLDAVVDEAIDMAAASGTGPSNPKFRIVSVYAHVWEASEDSLGWYKRRGFEVERLREQYYRKLKPAGAWVVRKKIAIA